MFSRSSSVLVFNGQPHIYPKIGSLRSWSYSTHLDWECIDTLCSFWWFNVHFCISGTLLFVPPAFIVRKANNAAECHTATSIDEFCNYMTCRRRL
jgi:hypothetical protein